MRELSRQENTSSCSPRTKSPTHEEVHEVEEESDQRQEHRRKDSVLPYRTRYRATLNGHSP